MKRSRIVFFLCAPALALMAIVVSCSDAGNDKPVKRSTGRYYQPKDGGASEGSPAIASSSSMVEAGAIPDGNFDMPKELKGPGQALQVLVTSYDLEVKEVQAAEGNINTPAFKAYVNDLMKGLQTSRARVKALAGQKKVSLARSNMTERMKFESQAAIQHERNIFRNMWADTFMTRRMDTANNLSRTIDNDIAPTLGDDEDYKAELAKVHEELDKRVARAEAVKNGLSEGPATSQGMFDVPAEEDPAGPVVVEHDPPPEKPPASTGGDASAAP